MSESGGAMVDERWPKGRTRFEERFGNNLTRIIVALVGIPLVLGLFYLGGWWFVGFVTAISVGALLEFYWMLEKRGFHPNKGVGVLACIIPAIASGWDLAVSEQDQLMVISLMVLQVISLLFFSLVTLIATLRREKEDALGSMVGTLSGILYVPFFLNSMLSLYAIFLLFEIRESLGNAFEGNLGPFYFFMIMLAGIWICDSGAYFGGRAFGKHKLFERVSPKKTWEGAITGALFSIVTVGFLLPWVFPRLSWVDGVAVGLIAGIFGQIGDLVESHIKRACEVKDSSQIIPGHGGLLDRFDSLLFVAPATFLYFIVRLFLDSGRI
ncbi:MAG: phosphatidate cytidylyltransferase [Ignavibacteriae bacterium]|nr:phosphatidate cytidylyltransferase [Ignavibacteriota bacterium]MCB9216878.1 phosphatidate cytidylyltransferase [Ignavibacteria bacterium]